MPRRKIPIKTGNYYQVVNSGFCKMRIFKDLEDYQKFKNLVVKYSDGVQIDSYALEPNHYHFVIKQLADKAVCKMFTRLQMAYSKYFNKKYKEKGTIYEKRFYAEELVTRQHYQNSLRYVFNNPVKHKLVNLGADGVAGLGGF